MKRRCVIQRRLMHRRTELARRKARARYVPGRGRCGQHTLPGREGLVDRAIIAAAALLSLSKRLTMRGVR